jgi:CRP/FNR family transcriptional regulator, dissimilatory nitrate respiration regulator
LPAEQTLSNESLKKLPPFTELSIEDLRKITSISKLKKFSKSQILFSEGDPYTGFYILLKGAVKVFRLSSEGKESIFHLKKPFDSFGDIALFEGGSYVVNAQATSDSTLLFIPRKEFLILLKKNPQLSLKMLESFAKRLRVLTQKVEDLTTKDIIGRLASYLVDEIIKNGVENLSEPVINLSVPKKNIAAFLGTITETLSRTFKKLQNEKIIRISGKNIFILDLHRLKKLSS